MRPRVVQAMYLFALSALTAFAQSPFVGDWKLNAGKSHLTGEIITFSPAAGQAIQYSAEDRSYSFKTDGKEYAGTVGEQYVWKMIDDHTYQSTSSRKGVVLGTTVWKVSSDEKTLNLEETGTMPSGKAFDITSTYARVSGSRGLLGSWQNQSIKLNEDQIMTWKAAEGDSVRWELPDLRAYVILSFDGKECAPVGPTMPEGLTLSATKTGPTSFTMKEKLNGKLLTNNHYTISSDGKTLTAVSAPPDGKAPATTVYEKQ